MQLQNISRSEISKTLDRGAYTGCFYVPNVLFDLPLTKAEKMLLVVLFKKKHDFQRKAALHDRWFFVTTKTLASMTGCKDTTIRHLRQRLARMGLIDYRQGKWSLRRATLFKILIPDF